MFVKYGNNRKLPHGEEFSILAEFQIDLLKEMKMSLESSLNEERKQLEKLVKGLKAEQYESDYDYHSHLGSICDDFIQTNEIENIMKLLIVVRLYIIVELTTKRVLKWLIQDRKKENQDQLFRKVSKWENLKKIFKKFGVNLNDISDFNVINELRCLNNAIKHGGYVDEELAQFPIWKNELKKEINADKIGLEGFYNSVPKYIFDLVEKANAGSTANSTIFS